MARRPLPASFRDPGGFLFRCGGTLYRQIDAPAIEDFRFLHGSGLYGSLVDRQLLVQHREVSPELAPGAEAVIEPEPVPFISYPYEWSFSQLKDAALATLRIQELAMDHGMTLKDASAYNIQFLRGRPTLIDTLSLARYREGEPWVAYRQFCQHFLAPLALMARRDVRLLSLLRTHLDGIPLDLASRLLPVRTRFSPGLAMHLHAHAASQKKHEGDRKSAKGTRVSPRGLRGIVESLRGVVRKLEWTPAGTEWGAYYDHTNYDEAALSRKRALVDEFLAATGARSCWDLGANDGTFSRIASNRGLDTVALDIDPAAVEHNWRSVRERDETRLLPLLMDLTNPSPGLGWEHAERDALLDRGPVDVVLALALVHHLAIGNNVPLERVADFLFRAGRWVVVEFVPKGDSQVERMLATREDVFPGYTPERFESAVRVRSEIVRKQRIEGTERVLYLLRGEDR